MYICSVYENRKVNGRFPTAIKCSLCSERSEYYLSIENEKYVDTSIESKLYICRECLIKYMGNVNEAYVKYNYSGGM